jgi:hypothetical protein
MNALERAISTLQQEIIVRCVLGWQGLPLAAGEK